MDQTIAQTEQYCGFAAIIGAPNAGKSTLVNYLTGTKISIVTHKIQTTRFPVRGIIMQDNKQIILIDTPGIFAPKGRLDRAMVHSAWSGAKEADFIVHVIDAAAWAAHLEGNESAAERRSIKDDERIFTQLNQGGGRAVLVLNKIDLFARKQLLQISNEINQRAGYHQTFMISALKGLGLDRVRDCLFDSAKPGPWLYPEDQAADIPMQMLAAEITREKLMLRLHQELPYGLTVETESWERGKDGSIKIRQAIIVGKASHKSMVLGKGGQSIKTIGTLAREELEDIMETKIHLFLFVKTDTKWADRPAHYASMGLDFNA